MIVRRVLYVGMEDPPPHHVYCRSDALSALAQHKHTVELKSAGPESPSNVIAVLPESYAAGRYETKSETLHQTVGNKNPPLRRISAESGRGGFYYFSNLSSQFGGGVFNIFKSQPNLDGGVLIAHVFKSVDFGKIAVFRRKNPKISSRFAREINFLIFSEFGRGF